MLPFPWLPIPRRSLCRLVGPMDGLCFPAKVVCFREMEGFLKGEVVEVVTYIMVGHVFLGGHGFCEIFCC